MRNSTMVSSSESKKVNALYSYYQTLIDSGKDDIENQRLVYSKIIQAAHGCGKEKRLACQFIPAFFKNFPSLIESAVEAQLDLCEDADGAIRKLAIKELPGMCRDSSALIKQFVYVLTQLLPVKATSEYRIVCNTLVSLLKLDFEATVISFCRQIRFGDETVRQNSLHFLTSKMSEVPDEQRKFTANLSEIKAVLSIARIEEIAKVVEIASQCLSNSNKVAVIIAEDIETITSLDLYTDIKVERLIVLLKHLKLIQSETKVAQCTYTVASICQNILPNLSCIPGCDESTGYVLELLLSLAELAHDCDEMISSETTMKCIMKALMLFLPLNEVPGDTILFTHIECLLYILHKFSKYNQSVFKKNPEWFAGFKEKLVNLAHIVKAYFGRLEVQLDSQLVCNSSFKRVWPEAVKLAACGDDLLSPAVHSRREINFVETKDGTLHKSNNEIGCARKIKAMTRLKKNCLRAFAYDTCNNILKLIKDLSKQPPSCDTRVELSFLPVRTAKVIPARRTTDSSEELVKDKFCPYVPPNGRYSSILLRKGSN